MCEFGGKCYRTAEYVYIFLIRPPAFLLVTFNAGLKIGTGQQDRIGGQSRTGQTESLPEIVCRTGLYFGSWLQYTLAAYSNIREKS